MYITNIQEQSNPYISIPEQGLTPIVDGLASTIDKNPIGFCHYLGSALRIGTEIGLDKNVLNLTGDVIGVAENHLCDNTSLDHLKGTLRGTLSQYPVVTLDNFLKITS